MDLYGHNPFTARLPDLREGPLSYGTADFSDLDTLAGWLDRYGYRNSHGRRLRLFLSELTIPTDHASFEFNFWVSPRTQAQWLEAALRIARRWERIYTLGYLGLYDDAATARRARGQSRADQAVGQEETAIPCLSARMSHRPLSDPFDTDGA